tara:strand:- start:1140 stop:3065 length:1926 start_codon:yes stop_codon:yes gene_type:complete
MAEVKEYSLKLSTEQAQANLDELNQSLKLQEDLIEDIEVELRAYEKELLRTSKTNLAARKDVNDKIKQTKERLKDEKIALKAVNKDRKEANATLKESTANAKDYTGVLGMIDQKTGGMISGMRGMTDALGGATKGFKLMKVAIIGTGIGALLLSILALQKAFTSSEEGQNKFAKIMGVIGSVTGNLVTMLADLGEKIIAAFTDPKQALIDFGNAIVDNITNRITALIDTFGFLAKAVKNVFEGDFSGAMQSAKDAGSSFVDVMTGVEDTVGKATEAVKAFVRETKKEAKIAADIADKRAAADKLERALIVERAEANRSRAELLEKAVNKEKFAVEERIGFLEEAGKIEDEITAKEIAAAKLRYDAKVAENALADSTKEDLEEEANLRANLINLETAKLTKAKEVTSQIIALKAEEAAGIKAVQDKKDLEQAESDAKEIEDAKILAAALVEIEKQKLAQKQAIQDAEINMVSNGINLLKNIAGENKALQAAAIIGESALGIAKTIIATQTANAATIAQGAALAIPTAGASVATAASLVTKTNISAGIGIAANIAATSKALQAVKASGSAPAKPALKGGRGASVSSESTPPDFNTVGASGTNQLADAIGGQAQRPVRSYVVANDVTSAQSLERNIITGATIGD